MDIQSAQAQPCIRGGSIIREVAATGGAMATAAPPPRGFPCGICGKAFRSYQALGGHMSGYSRRSKKAAAAAAAAGRNAIAAPPVLPGSNPYSDLFESYQRIFFEHKIAADAGKGELSSVCGTAYSALGRPKRKREEEEQPAAPIIPTKPQAPTKIAVEEEEEEEKPPAPRFLKLFGKTIPLKPE